MENNSAKVGSDKTNYSLPEEQNTGKNKGRLRLTNRQEMFCQRVAAGLNFTDAAKQSGYKDSKHTHVNAYKISKYPVIKARIAELRKDLLKKFILSKEDMLSELGRIMRQGKDRDIIAAIQLSAKMQGMLVDDVNLNLKKSAKEMSDEELTAILLKAKDGPTESTELTSGAGVVGTQASQN
jgi:hypothetical protein